MVQHLVCFGNALEAARKRNGLTQRDLAAAYVEREGGPASDTRIANTQSFIAKLEAGRIANPQRDDISWLNEKLKIDQGVLAGAILRDRYLPEEAATVAYPLQKGVMTLKALAVWEGAENHSEVWIVAERYVDDHLRDFREAVLAILRRGGRIVFFLPHGRQEEFDEYKMWMSEVLTTSLDDRLIMIPLSLDQSALMAAPFVLANPSTFTDTYPQGFVLINDEKGEPCVAIRMSREEASDRARALTPVKRRALRMSPALSSIRKPTS